MTILEAIDARHSVRAYQDQRIDQETRRQLDSFTETCSQESGLHFWIRYDDPDGSGVWYRGRQCIQYETVCTVDDDLILFFSKKLRGD